MDPVIAADLIEPAIEIVAGTAMLLYPARHRLRAERDRAARLKQIEAGSEEVFFEEKRSLQAYPPVRNDKVWQLLGVLLVLAGVLQLYDLLA